MESPGSARSTLSSPEAEVGLRVEDLWDIQEPQLSPSQKLNSCFESLPVSSFPIASAHLVDIPSDATLADAVQILSKSNILSAPVRNVDAPEDASWIDKYIGVVEFAGIAVWLLHQSELATRDENSNDSKVGIEGLTNKLSTIKVNGTKEEPPAASVDGTFLQNLTSSDLYKNTKVRDISGSFRWAPFLALQSSDSFLTMLLLLSKYRMKSLPVVDLGEGKIENIITQSAVVHMLEECVGLHWFEDWGTKKLFELGLPINNKLVKVREDESVLKAFQLMRKRRVGALPVVDKTRKKAIGNISLRDVHYLLTSAEIFKDYRSITTKDFITTVRDHIKEDKDSFGSLEVVSCKRDDTIKDVIIKLDAEKIQRVYVVDKDGNLEGVITLRDIISRLVHEPNGYFGDFFDGVVPLPENSTV